VTTPENEPSTASDWVTAMRAGDFARAWAIADADIAGLNTRGPAKHEGPRHLQRIWRGEDLHDRIVLVRCYHGLGDTIQFARFLAPLARIAREVIVWCQSPLLGLISRIPGVSTVLPLHDGAPDVRFDVDIEIMELAHALRADRELVHAGWPYLEPAGPPATLPKHAGLTVGLVWRVGNWDKRREVPAPLVRKLIVPGVAAFSLQRDVAAAEIAEVGAIDISMAEIDDLSNTLRALDLVITVDTMVAHLAGALGCETWIMLHADCDWRWPARGRESTWYPRAQLFHQRRHGDWCGVVAEIAGSLRARVGAISSAPPNRATRPMPDGQRNSGRAAAFGGASDSPGESPQAASIPPSP